MLLTKGSLLVLGVEGAGETAVVAAHFLVAFWGVTIFFEVAGLAATAGVGNHELSVVEQLQIGHYHQEILSGLGPQKHNLQPRVLLQEFHDSSVPMQPPRLII